MQKKPLYIMLVLFIAPIIFAKLVLMNGWYQGAETNSGQLISPPITISNTSNAWLMLYNPPKHCNEQCLQSLWQIQQVHILLAAEGERVQTYLLSAVNKLTATSELKLKNNNKLAVKDIPLPSIISANINNQEFTPNTLYLVDPLGNAFMQYQFPAEYENAVSISAGLLKDMKRLLKISKIG